MKIIDLEQGSDAWLEYRRNKIGASDASIIMGCNPWSTPLKLYNQKIQGEVIPSNPAMEKGKLLEDGARILFNKKMGFNCQPVVAESEMSPWMMASYDGVDFEKKVFVEIKCGGKELYEKAQFGEIPEYYRTQIQHQYSVAASEGFQGYYCVYFEGSIAVLDVKEDQVYICKMIIEESKFYDKLVTREPPDPIASDYLPFSHSRASELLIEYLDLCKELKSKKARQDEIKKELIEIGPQVNFILDGVKIYQSQNSSYDYARMREDGIDLSQYKKASKPYWVIASPRS